METTSDSGGVAGLPVPSVVYRNAVTPTSPFANLAFFPNANQRLADDLTLAGGACSEVVSVSVQVGGFGDAAGNNTTFDVTVALYTDDPCVGGVLIATRDVTAVPSNGLVQDVTVSFEPPVAVPATVWLALTFSNDFGAWIVGEEAELGSTEDGFSEDDRDTVPFTCGFFFLIVNTDPPTPVYAGFVATVECLLAGDALGACCTGTACSETTDAECTQGTWLGAFTGCDPSPCLPGVCCTGFDFGTCAASTEAMCQTNRGLFHELDVCDGTGAAGGGPTCKPAFEGLINDLDALQFLSIPADSKFADDMELALGATCELVAYDFAMAGIDGTGAFDVHTELWTNDDGGTPNDPLDDKPLALIPGTEADFANVLADQFRHILSVGPLDKIVLPEKMWFVISATSPDAGPLFSGIPLPGSSLDGFAVFPNPDAPAGSPDDWGLGFWFGGFEPEGCPLDPPCNAAGSFWAHIWCNGDPPVGSCCNDDAQTSVDGVIQVHCDGRWTPGSAGALDPPCGSGACCKKTQDGLLVFCEDLPMSQCTAERGVPVPGAVCEVQCPPAVCIDAAGSCDAANGSVGCDDASCCETVCDFDSFCCDPENAWDSICAGHAATLCQSRPANDHCADAEKITGEGIFAFDNTSATVDGPPHETCEFAGRDQQFAHDLWYEWNSTCDGRVFVRTCGLTEVDTKLAAYDTDTCPVGDADLLRCDENLCATNNRLQSMVIFDALPSRSYLIRVASFPGGGGFPADVGGVGQFEITCGPPPHGACPGTTDCCSEPGSPTPSCSDEECCAAVCACDPFCCGDGGGDWDARCANAGIGNLGCGAAVLCADLCAICPDGLVTWIDPVDQVVDARLPHLLDDSALRKGISAVIVDAPIGAGVVECWNLCETDDGGTPNSIRSITDLGGGMLNIRFLRQIAPGAVTTITYKGNGSTCSFISHPGNVNGVGGVDVDDLTELLSVLAAPETARWGLYSADINHTGAITTADLFEWANVAGGSGQLLRWLGTPLPSGTGCP